MEVFPNWTAIPIFFFVVVLTYILSKTFFGPVGRVLQERHRLIEGAREEAKEIRRATEDRLGEFDRKMREARREAGLHMVEVKSGALAERQAIVTRQRAEADRNLASARQDIRAKAEEARKSLEAEAVNISYRIASRILRRTIVKKG